MTALSAGVTLMTAVATVAHDVGCGDALGVDPGAGDGGPATGMGVPRVRLVGMAVCGWSRVMIRLLIVILCLTVLTPGLVLAYGWWVTRGTTGPRVSE